MLLIILLNVFYAWMFIISKFALQTGHPVFMTAVRMMLGGAGSLAIFYITSRKSLFKVSSITSQQWQLIGLLSVTNIYLSNALQYWGLQYLSAGKTAFFYNLGPFFAALLAYFLFSEKMTLQKWLGLTLGFLGFIPVFMGSTSHIDTSIQFEYVSAAEVALLFSAAAVVIGWTKMKILLSYEQFSVFFLNGISMMLGGILCFVHAFIFESSPYVFSGQALNFFGYALAMALTQNIIAYNLHAHLLTRYSTTLLTFFCFISSILAGVLGIVFLHETFSINLIIASIFVLLGLILFYQEELKLGYMDNQ